VGLFDIDGGRSPIIDGRCGAGQSSGGDGAHRNPPIPAAIAALAESAQAGDEGRSHDMRRIGALSVDSGRSGASQVGPDRHGSLRGPNSSAGRSSRDLMPEPSEFSHSLFDYCTDRGIPLK
jgi:hypothetical protein